MNIRDDEAEKLIAELDAAIKTAGRSEKTKKVKAPTFAQKRSELLAELTALGWAVRDDLKVPHATSPRGGETRFWFKSQAIYYTFGRHHEFKNAASLVSDMRTLVNAVQLVSLADRSRRGEFDRF